MEECQIKAMKRAAHFFLYAVKANIVKPYVA